jgi:hypothetical protein
MLCRRGLYSTTVVSVFIGLMLSVGLVVKSSFALFTGTTSNTSNSFAAANVSLSDDDTGSALFTVTGLYPGSSAIRCLRVTYNGDITAVVRFYTTASTYSGTLGPYVTLTIDEGAAGTYADPTCSNWTTGTTVYTGLLSTFASTYTNYSNGAYKAGGAWTPTGSTQAKTYRFTYLVSAAAPNSAQGTSAGIGFTFEAQG